VLALNCTHRYSACNTHTFRLFLCSTYHIHSPWYTKKTCPKLFWGHTWHKSCKAGDLFPIMCTMWCVCTDRQEHVFSSFILLFFYCLLIILAYFLCACLISHVSCMRLVFLNLKTPFPFLLFFVIQMYHSMPTFTTGRPTCTLLILMSNPCYLFHIVCIYSLLLPQ
jgi:hypothetical protein